MKYRKKPVVIDADVFQWGMEDGIQRGSFYVPKDAATYHESMESSKYKGYLGRYDGENDERGFDSFSYKPYIDTLEGHMFISDGDYIITGIKGERYPCKPDIFEKTYEKV